MLVPTACSFHLQIPGFPIVHVPLSTFQTFYYNLENKQWMSVDFHFMITCDLSDLILKLHPLPFYLFRKCPYFW